MSQVANTQVRGNSHYRTLIVDMNQNPEDCRKAIEFFRELGLAVDILDVTEYPQHSLQTPVAFNAQGTKFEGLPTIQKYRNAFDLTFSETNSTF
jgi:hypothetical protein